MKGEERRIGDTVPSIMYVFCVYIFIVLVSSYCQLSAYYLSGGSIGNGHIVTLARNSKWQTGVAIIA